MPTFTNMIKNEMPQIPVISAIWITGRVRYCEYPKSAQPKPNGPTERSHSRVTQAHGITNRPWTVDRGPWTINSPKAAKNNASYKTTITIPGRVTWTSHQIVPRKNIIPARYAMRKARIGLLSSMANKRGTNANHTKISRLKGGNDNIRKSEDMTARKMCFLLFAAAFLILLSTPARTWVISAYFRCFPHIGRLGL